MVEYVTRDLEDLALLGSLLVLCLLVVCFLEVSNSPSLGLLVLELFSFRSSSFV